MYSVFLLYFPSFVLISYKIKVTEVMFAALRAFIFQNNKTKQGKIQRNTLNFSSHLQSNFVPGKLVSLEALLLVRQPTICSSNFRLVTQNLKDEKKFCFGASKQVVEEAEAAAGDCKVKQAKTNIYIPISYSQCLRTVSYTHLTLPTNREV